MRIAIVEDNPSDLEDTLATIRHYCDGRNIEATCDTFSSAEAYLHSDSACDIALLDIELPKLSGMELAHKIRETEPHLPIIFLTSMSKYAIEGYSVNAIGYVLKPINPFNFALAMDRAVSVSISSSSRGGVLVKAGTESFPVSSIYFCEVRDHTIVFHLDAKEASCRRSLSEIEKIGGDRFARPHASFLVNLDKVSLVRGDEILLQNGESVPLSRSKKKEFMSAIALHIGRSK